MIIIINSYIKGRHMENYNIEYKREIPKKANLLKAEIVFF